MSGKAAVVATRHSKFRRHFRITFGSLRFYIVLAIVIVILHSIDAVLTSMPVLVDADPALASDLMKKQIDLWSEMNKLLIAFATVTIGAIGGFMLNRDKTHPLSPPQRRRAAASWFFCAVSLYFGYLSYQQAALMLKHGAFDLLTPRLWWPSRGQFWAYLLSIVLFADFIYTSIRDKKNEQ